MSDDDAVIGGAAQPEPAAPAAPAESAPQPQRTLREAKLEAVLAGHAPNLDIEAELRHVAGLTMADGRVAGQAAYRPPTPPAAGGPAPPQGAQAGGIDWSSASPSQIVAEVDKRVAVNTADSNLI